MVRLSSVLLLLYATQVVISLSDFQLLVVNQSNIIKRVGNYHAWAVNNSSLYLSPLRQGFQFIEKAKLFKRTVFKLGVLLGNLGKIKRNFRFHTQYIFLSAQTEI